MCGENDKVNVKKTTQHNCLFLVRLIIIELILRVRQKPLYMSYWRLSLIQQNLFSWKQRRWISKKKFYFPKQKIIAD